MKVIFIKNLKNQGRINDVKEVSDGYATNFLIKNGYAVKYTKASKEILTNDIKKEIANEEKKIREALSLKEKIDNIELKFAVSANNGRVFGSISSKQICEELAKKGIVLDKKMIKINGSISSLGVHNVSVVLHKKVQADLSVHLIEKQKQEIIYE